MNTIIIILIIVTVIFTVIVSVFLFYSIYSKSYLTYRKKLEDFENKKKRIEEDLDNDRKKFH